MPPVRGRRLSVRPPPLVWGLAPAPFLLVGQAPGLSDWRGDRMYLGPAARKLVGWLCEAGFTEATSARRST